MRYISLNSGRQRRAIIMAQGVNELVKFFAGWHIRIVMRATHQMSTRERLGARKDQATVLMLRTRDHATADYA